jgi:hypothetical protein
VTKTNRMLAALGALVGALALAAATSADPVTGGKTVLKLDQDTAEGFADMSIGIETTGAGKDGKNGLSWPIKGGDVNEGPKGSLEHRGGIAFFTEGGPGTKFSKFRIKIQSADKAKLFAKSGNSEARFLDLNLKKATIGGSEGVNLKIKGAEAALAKQGAEVLTETFDFPFKKGIPMGTVTIKAAVGS